MRQSHVVGSTLLLALAAFVSAQEQVVRPGFFGIGYGPTQGMGQGVAVLEVTPGSPAEKAGLKAGDILSKINDQDVRDADTFRRIMSGTKPGEQLNLRVLRQGKEQPIKITLGEQPGVPGVVPPERRATPPGVVPPERRETTPLPPERRDTSPPDADVRRPALLGIRTEELTPDVKKQLNIEADSGVVVGEVRPDSPAEKAGLKQNDVITSVGSTMITNPTELRDALRKAGPGKGITLGVLRGKEKMSLKVTLGGPEQK